MDGNWKKIKRRSSVMSKEYYFDGEKMDQKYDFSWEKFENGILSLCVFCRAKVFYNMVSISYFGGFPS